MPPSASSSLLFGSHAFKQLPVVENDNDNDGDNDDDSTEIMIKEQTTNGTTTTGGMMLLENQKQGKHVDSVYNGMMKTETKKKTKKTIRLW